MGSHVVVGYDGSPESVAAVRWAAGAAQRLEVPLQVVHVWGLAGQLDTPPTRAASAYLREGAREVAEEGAQVARDEVPGLEVSAVLDDGPPARALVDRAVHAPLVVVGRQGSARLSGVLLGSVALGTLQHAPCPVVVVPRTRLDHAPTGLVVVGVDGSRQSLGATAAAGRYAARTGARLRAVACWQAPLRGRSLADWLRDHPDVSPEDVARSTADAALQRARVVLHEQYPDVPLEELVEEGQPAHVLARHAEQADLLVVGTRGRSGLAGLVLGSVSQWLVARASCPVLVSRAVPD